MQVMALGVAAERCHDVDVGLRRPLRELLEELIRLVLEFVSNEPAPLEMWRCERCVAELLRRIGCLALQFAVNQFEPDDANQMPSRLCRGSAEFSRKGTKTRQRAGVACLFGMIEVWRWSYEPLAEEREAGLRSIAPLLDQLGIVEGKATPALAEVIGRLAQERSESGVVEFLAREHDVHLSAKTVCRVRDAVAQGVSEHLRDQQVRVLLSAIQEGQRQGRVTLSVGRDGIFVPLRKVQNDRWKEAAVGTVSVYVKPPRGNARRLCTVYLGQMPKPGQEELSDYLTALLQQVLSDNSARNLRLVYVTDAGHHPQDYFERVLQEMNNPHRPTKKLVWTRVVDFFHACGRLNQFADALFHDPAVASTWVRRMRHILKHAPNAVHKILHSAAALRPKSLRGKAKENYESAYNYLLNHRSGMDYAAYRKQHLPIGSGVTEAACKTVFTQRFKCSGMIWGRDQDYDHRDPDAVHSGARSVLTLRLAVLSRVWPAVFQAYLNANTAKAKTETRQHPLAPRTRNAA
jgi:hypothetical protein